MGIFNSPERQKVKRETEAYRRILAEKTRLASRQAYADEAIKVAKEKAKAKARQPSFLARAGGISLKVGKTIGRGIVKSTQPGYRTQRTATRKAGRKLARKSYPKKKVVRRYAPVQQAPRQTAPANLNQAIYGGY